MTTTEHERIAREFLAAVESRDLDAAAAHLADKVEFIFPGGHRTDDLASVSTGVAQRYRYVRKRIEAVDVAGSDERAIVYVRGMLFGEWPDGTAFEDIRFIDRFQFERSRIVSQQVWNDAGEARLARRKA